MEFSHRQDLPELAKSYLFNVKFFFENVPANKEDVEISFDEFEDYLITTCIKNEYLGHFHMSIVHYSSDMKPVYEERFFDCKAAYVEEFSYDKFNSSQDGLVKTIGIKCKRSK